MSACEVIEVRPAAKSVVVVQDAPSIVEVVSVGPQGPIGPQGIPGTVDDYTQAFASAASTWTVNHNLGREPAIQVLSVGGVELVADVVHVSNNQAQISFAAPTAGRVRAI